MNTYLFTYSYDGAFWEFRIYADSVQEAKERAARLPYAAYTGELKCEMGCGRLARLWQWIRGE